MARAKAINLTGVEWAFFAVVIALLGCILTGKLIAAKKYEIRYKHSLAYPKFQARTLIQVGSLDRG